MARWQGNPLTSSHLIGITSGGWRTRAQCREWIEKQYGYIRDRPDLREAPHFWRVPRAVKVTVTVTED